MPLPWIVAPILAAGAYARLGFYGNWCGKGLSGGEYYPDNINWAMDGVDSVDEACKVHDEKFDDADNLLKAGYIDQQQYDRLINDANKILVDQLRATEDDSTLSSDAIGMRERAIWYFDKQIENYEKKSCPKPVDPESWLYPFEQGEAAVCPLILDLDGDGVTAAPIDQGVFFDHNGDGFAELSAWSSNSDGFLVRDRNGDGKITTGDELFGDQTRMLDGRWGQNGFNVLAEYDDDHDGQINEQDLIWETLSVWVDANHDGVSQSPEIRTLSDVGIASIGTGYSASQDGKVLHGTYTNSDGSTGHSVDDSTFSVNSTYTIAEDWTPVSQAISSLPDISGYGRVRDLHQAMARDPELTVLVEAFCAATGVTERNDLLSQIVFRWAGSDGVDPHSRDNTTYGTTWDARKLVALEMFVGCH